jgi:hypothetical protein
VNSEGDIHPTIRKYLGSGNSKQAMLLRLRACGGTAPASVPALVRARLARRASSASCAAAASSSASSALEELAAERKGLTSPSLWHSAERLRAAVSCTCGAGTPSR